MKKLLVLLFFIFLSVPAYPQVFGDDCRDINGDLIPDCTCTDMAGNPVSCTDGTPIVPCTSCGNTIPPGGINTGNDGIDNDGDGLIDEADEQPGYSDVKNLGRSGQPGYRRPQTTPTDLFLQVNPRRLEFPYYIISKFDINVDYIFSGENLPFKSDDIINLKIKNAYNNKIFEKDVDYIREYDFDNNHAKIHVQFYPESLNNVRVIIVSTSINNNFLETFPVVVDSKKTDYGNSLPSKRVLKSRRIF